MIPSLIQNVENSLPTLYHALSHNSCLTKPCLVIPFIMQFTSAEPLMVDRAKASGQHVKRSAINKRINLFLLEEVDASHPWKQFLCFDDPFILETDAFNLHTAGILMQKRNLQKAVISY